MRARLIPPGSPVELSLEASLAIHHETRQQNKARIRRLRQRAAKHLIHLSDRHRVQGYTEGLQQGKAEFAEAALCLSQRYNEASKAAEQEAKELAVLLAEQVIETHIGQCSEPLSRSLHQAAELLRSTTPHVLLIHPRLEKIVSQVSHSLPTGIRTEVNRTPGAPDFILVGESGAVEFAWRSALKAVTESR